MDEDNKIYQPFKVTKDINSQNLTPHLRTDKILGKCNYENARLHSRVCVKHLRKFQSEYAGLCFNAQK
jgi:hypothetical protein